MTGGFGRVAGTGGCAQDPLGCVVEAESGPGGGQSVPGDRCTLAPLAGLLEQRDLGAEPPT